MFGSTPGKPLQNSSLGKRVLSGRYWGNLVACTLPVGPCESTGAPSQGHGATFGPTVSSVDPFIALGAGAWREICKVVAVPTGSAGIGSCWRDQQMGNAINPWGLHTGCRVCNSFPYRHVNQFGIASFAAWQGPYLENELLAFSPPHQTQTRRDSHRNFLHQGIDIQVPKDYK